MYLSYEYKKNKVSTWKKQLIIPFLLCKTIIIILLDILSLCQMIFLGIHIKILTLN